MTGRHQLLERRGRAGWNTQDGDVNTLVHQFTKQGALVDLGEGAAGDPEPEPIGVQRGWRQVWLGTDQGAFPWTLTCSLTM